MEITIVLLWELSELIHVKPLRTILGNSKCYKRVGASQVALVVKNPPCHCRRCKRHGFDPWMGKIRLEEGLATHSKHTACTCRRFSQYSCYFYRIVTNDPIDKCWFLCLSLFLPLPLSDFSTAPNITGRPMPNPSVRSTDHENGDIVLMKRRVFGHRIIIINYAVNDFYFFSEMEK